MSEDNINVTLRLPDGKRHRFDQLYNISLGGIFVEMPEPLAFGTELGVEFELQGGRKKATCSGFVVWSTRTSPDKAGGRDGIAVRLADISVAEMRMVAEAVGQPLEGM